MRSIIFTILTGNIYFAKDVSFGTRPVVSQISLARGSCDVAWVVIPCFYWPAPCPHAAFSSGFTI